jgi:hypothetical protein
MNEWMVHLETVEGVAFDADTVVQFRESLEAILGMTGAAASVNTVTGLLTASFSVSAPIAVTAAEAGAKTFLKAAAACGLGVLEFARVEVERVATAETVPA